METSGGLTDDLTAGQLWKVEPATKRELRYFEEFAARDGFEVGD